MPERTPPTVKDQWSWDLIQEIDLHGVSLTSWELDFLETMMRFVVRGRVLTHPQRRKLADIRAQRVPEEE